MEEESNSSYPPTPLNASITKKIALNTEHFKAEMLTAYTKTCESHMEFDMLQAR